MRQCDYSDCVKPAAKGGLCWAHRKQRQRGQPLRELGDRGRSPHRVLMDAVLDLIEVDAWDKASWDKAWHRVRVAARRYAFAEKPQNRYRPASGM